MTKRLLTRLDLLMETSRYADKFPTVVLPETDPIRQEIRNLATMPSAKPSEELAFWEAVRTQLSGGIADLTTPKELNEFEAMLRDMDEKELKETTDRLLKATRAFRQRMIDRNYGKEGAFKGRKVGKKKTDGGLSGTVKSVLRTLIGGFGGGFGYFTRFAWKMGAAIWGGQLFSEFVGNATQEIYTNAAGENTGEYGPGVVADAQEWIAAGSPDLYMGFWSTTLVVIIMYLLLLWAWWRLGLGDAFERVRSERNRGRPDTPVPSEERFNRQIRINDIKDELVSFCDERIKFLKGESR